MEQSKAVVQVCSDCRGQNAKNFRPVDCRMHRADSQPAGHDHFATLYDGITGEDVLNPLERLPLPHAASFRRSRCRSRRAPDVFFLDLGIGWISDPERWSVWSKQALLHVSVCSQEAVWLLTHLSRMLPFVRYPPFSQERRLDRPVWPRSLSLMRPYGGSRSGQCPRRISWQTCQPGKARTGQPGNGQRIAPRRTIRCPGASHVRP